MAIPILMPRQGQSVESCIISEWFVKKGDTVKEGDKLFSYETDKAVFEEESKVSGVVLDIFFPEGEDVPVLTNVSVIGDTGEDYSEFIPGNDANNSRGAATTQKSDAFAPEESDVAPGSTTFASGDNPAVQGQQENLPASQFASAVFRPEQAGGKPVATGTEFISPRARNLAEKAGVDIRFAVPTGPNGRTIERDIRLLQQQGHLVNAGAKEGYMIFGQPVSGSGLSGRITTQDLQSITAQSQSQDMSAEQANAVWTASAPTTPIAAYRDVRLSNIRKVIGRSMHESLSQMAQLTLNTSFDATEIMRYRQQLKAGAEKSGLSNITINDILIYATSRILPKHGAINAHFLGDFIRHFTNVHMGVAVDTDRGLMVPTLMNANLKPLNEISIEAKELAKACQKGTINPDKLKEGTFTITNLGALGIESFTPVINPPQTAILGVNTVVQKVRENNGVMEVYPSMQLSLTFDHRAVDGAPAARFLKELKEALENFTILLAG